MNFYHFYIKDTSSIAIMILHVSRLNAVEIINTEAISPL